MVRDRPEGGEVMGLIELATEIVRTMKGSGAPQPQVAPGNNFFFMTPQGPIAPQTMLGPQVSGYGYEPLAASRLHVNFTAGEDDDDYFSLDQPAVVMVAPLEEDDELTVGLRLANQLDVEVAPGWYGVLAVVYMDDDLNEVDGLGFTLVPVEDWGYDIDVDVELMEADEVEAEEMLEEIDDALAEAFA